MSTCIDLQARYGDRYRITFDQAAQTPTERRDPWMMQIPCRRGTIYPHGVDRLAVEIDYRHRTAAQVAALPDVVCVQNGDREKTFVFPVTAFDAVAAIVEPKRRRRRLSEDQRQKLISVGAKYRFPTRQATISRKTDREASNA